MVAKISVGSSLYGAIAYNGEKINEAQGRLLTTNRIYNDGSGTVDIGKAMEGFLTFLPPQMKIEKPVVHISLNPHPEDVLTDIELQNIAREYLEKLGFGNQPYLVFKHEDIDRHHLHICLLYTSITRAAAWNSSSSISRKKSRMLFFMLYRDPQWRLRSGRRTRRNGDCVRRSA